MFILNKISYITMNKTFAIIAVAALIAGAAYFTTETTRTPLFDEWKSQYGANWAPVEEEYRRIVFSKNVEIINKHNADKTQTYKMGINQFTAMTEEEFFNTYLDPKPEVAAPVEEIMEPNADVGPPREESPELRTKATAVHAGHSLLSELWNQSPRLKDKLLISLNNNSLTALPHTEITDAMEDGLHQL